MKSSKKNNCFQLKWLGECTDLTVIEQIRRNSIDVHELQWERLIENIFFEKSLSNLENVLHTNYLLCNK